MTQPTHDEPTKLSQEILDALDGVSGRHAGYRPVHAKGAMFTGTFTPAAEAAALTRAPHAARASTPVTVRFSDAAGVPTVPDNDPEGGNPRGLAVRFHLGEHEHTDIVTNTHNGFPVRTGEEFAELLRAIAAAKAGDPSAIGAFLGSHPAAAKYVGEPQPTPKSFATDTYFGVTAFLFTNAAGETAYGRFRILPEGGDAYMTDEEVAAMSPNFLFDELAERVASGPARFDVVVQIAEPGDTVDDATSIWPEERRFVKFGTIALTGAVPADEAEARRLIFDPVPRVDGVDPSGDPLTEARSGVYLLSGRRRRADDAQTASA